MPRSRIGPTSIIDSIRISTVLHGLRYPARTWQLIAHADHYGADSVSRAELRRLPATTYLTLAMVIAALAGPEPTHPAGPPAPR